MKPYRDIILTRLDVIDVLSIYGPIRFEDRVALLGRDFSGSSEISITGVLHERW